MRITYHKIFKAIKVYENSVIFNQNMLVRMYIHMVSCLLVIFILSQLYDNLENFS